MKPRLDNHVFLPMQQAGCRGRCVCGHVCVKSALTWPQTQRPRHLAFTLVELLVVVAMIALVMGITLPGIIGLFTAGSDLQARNVISGTFGAARGVAIENQSYAGVHVQIGTDDKCWIAVMQYDKDPSSPSFGKFVPVSGFSPQQMPGDMAFGEITSDYVTGSSYDAAVDTADGLKGFTTFNVIFGPDGSLATLVNGAVPQIETNVKIFGGDSATAEQQIWDASDLGLTLDEAGVRAITAFHYKTLVSISSRSGWLEKNGQFLCVNPYTGKLLPTK